jgi:hypothetical protein
MIATPKEQTSAIHFSVTETAYYILRLFVDYKVSRRLFPQMKDR